MACFADINVSQGSVATYARCAGILNIHLTTNLPRNLSMKKNSSVKIWQNYGHMSPWPHFLAHPVCDSCCALNNKLGSHYKNLYCVHFVCLSDVLFRREKLILSTLRILATGEWLRTAQFSFISFFHFSRPPRRHGPDHTHEQSPYMSRSNGPSGLSETRVWSGPVRSGQCSGIYYNACDRQTDIRTDIAYTYTVASRG